MDGWTDGNRSLSTLCIHSPIHLPMYLYQSIHSSIYLSTYLPIYINKSIKRHQWFETRNQRIIIDSYCYVLSKYWFPFITLIAPQFPLGMLSSIPSLCDLDRAISIFHLSPSNKQNPNGECRMSKWQMQGDKLAQWEPTLGLALECWKRRTFPVNLLKC